MGSTRYQAAPNVGPERPLPAPGLGLADDHETPGHLIILEQRKSPAGRRAPVRTKPTPPLDWASSLGVVFATPEITLSMEIATMSFRRVIAGLLLVGLTSCATMLDYDGPDAGQLVMSMSLPKDSYGYDVACIGYRAKVGGRTGRFCLGGSEPRLNPDLARLHRLAQFEEGPFVGKVGARALMPGEYEVTGWSLMSGGPEHIVSSKPMALPFTIKPGVSTYIGSYRWTLTTKTNFVGTLFANGASLAISNRKARDVEIAAKLRAIPAQIEVALPVPDGNR